MKTILIAVFCLLLVSCTQKTLFKKLSSEETGIAFNNAIQENDSLNTLDLEFLYNGGGVAVGDFNKDGLPDLYFTASVTSNKLYLNKGNLKFEDVTGKAGVSGVGEWSNAASVIDINNDGFEDIYVCTTIKSDPQQRRNLLYINEGKQTDGVPRFKEMASAYGLADTSYAVHAAFLDYDNDGDLDMYLVTTKLAKRASTSLGIRDTSSEDYDRLYRNDWNAALKHPVFTDVSKAAGIHQHGYGLGVAVVDINKDGWKDIYVTNDFFSSDHLYINNKNGTFTDEVRDYFKHTARNAMGNAVADINNDGLEDVLTVDMNPEDNYRKKKNMSGYNYYEYQRMLYDSNELQYVRNTLQLNMGPRVNGNDSIGAPAFGDISFYTGTAETDWSWNPSIADFDNDGNNDIIITNGYPRDVTDHDFIAFRGMAKGFIKKQDIINEIPIVKIPNYAYKNNGNLKFENITKDWGLDEPSFSNGAVAVDLDNDGDLDYVINNINEEAFVYENTLNDKEKTQKNYIKIAFDGGAQNTKGIGAIVELYYGKTKQVYDNEPCRGYLSCTDTKAFFGLDSTKTIDSLVIRWPNLTRQTIKGVKANQLLTVNIANAHTPDSWDAPQIDSTALFTDITANANIHYKQFEADYIDFDKERLLPHKFSQYGPGLAVADINGDGLDDMYIGGCTDQNGSLLLQQPDGKFIQKLFPGDSIDSRGRPENMGVLLFDADGDGDNDLWCANGSNEYPANSSTYADRFYINDGKGNFRLDTTVIPLNYTSKSCLKAADYDGDGDLDLFIGGRCMPGNYPMPVSSFIYRNDSHNGIIKFTDVTASVCKDLQKIGMVCDAVWTDFDNDGATDLIVTGEWMPVTFFKNKGGKFENITAQTGIAGQKGWWSSLAAGDFDNDGDIDYIAGNLGLNAFVRGSDKEPVRVYAKDFDNNGNTDAVLTLYLKDQQGVRREYPALTRDDITSQMPALKKKYNAYKDFAVADIHQMFTPEQLKDALVLEANNFTSCYIQNNGNGKFVMKPLPQMAQLAPLNGMQTGDFNGDGNLDVAICANDYGNEITAGRYDAMNGLVLLGDGAGNFTAQTILQSGFFVPGDAKALVALTGADNSYLLAASQNKDDLKLFKSKLNTQHMVPVQSADRVAYITLSDGKKRKEELYFGTSFLSQSARFITKNNSIKQIEIVNAKGERRVVQ
ncbi:RNA-binding protein [Ilyomonas limi]|uniref:RNA-binding protein n=1 Tax=Ilyomonas limi TaxID=2575867 RepID=A0A4U3L2F7_9BACT|nr:VCBS repeat-containing protein [Ilyomonas limi]TKK69341.1 RNA-binding protein [Ilyomonas limi]